MFKLNNRLSRFEMDTGERNPLQLLEDEQYTKLPTLLISGKLVHTQTKFLFPDLNYSNKFATIDNEAQINTKNEYSNNRVFRTMSFAESNTLHTFCEGERTQLLNILAMSVKNQQLAGFFLPEIIVISHMLKVLLPCSVIVLTTSLLYI